MSRSGWVLAGLALVLVFVNLQVLGKERLVRDGQTVFLQLAPVDPRSLIQGDYMDLRYQVATEVPADAPATGRLVLRRAEDGVATFVRVDDGQPLGPGETLLKYRKRDGDVLLGAESFFFQEGRAGRFAEARYGELKVGPSGDSVLVGLRGEGLQEL